MKFLVLSRSRAGREAPDHSHATISITDPSKPEAELLEIKHRVGVLRLSFTDMEERHAIVGGDVPFHPELAAEILRFVDTHRHDIETLVVHCEAGVSRSAGVAAALANLLGEDDARFFVEHYPNRTVRHMIFEEAWRQRWPRGERLIGDAIAPVEEVTLGESGTRVARFVTERGSFIRKAGDAELLRREAEVLSSLDGVTPLAPRFVGRDGEAFFQTELPGIPLSTAIHDAPEKIARLFGMALRDVHALFPARNGDVFSHGDWCLPNVLTDGETVTGIVDWADGGWRDPRLDLGARLWTLRYNLLTLVDSPSPEVCAAAERAFLDGYGWKGGVKPLEEFVKLYEEGK